ncbi:S8 family serine peptidase [Pendulispora brunnea]|uniref:S8 family serine peptidase n=1 Tax=Pendulispora brunnea TaxID=2905690 RepID=A0ABZ2KJ24_9BACT
MAHHKRYLGLFGLLILAAACQSEPGGSSGPGGSGANSNDFKVEQREGQSTLSVGSAVVRTTRAKVDGAALVKMQGTKAQTQVLSWNETVSGETTPYYAIQDARGWHPAKSTSYDVILRHRRFDPTQEVQSPSLGNAASSKLHIVQYVSQPIEEYRSAIKAAGGQVHQYMHGNAQLVRADSEAIARISALPFVRAVTPMTAADRTDDGLAVTRSFGGSVRVNVVMVDPKADRAVLADHIRALGGKILVNGEGILIEAEVPRSQVGALTQLDQVLWVEQGTAIEEDFENARIQGGANYLDALPDADPAFPDYTGIGIRGHIMEGINPTHPDFKAVQVGEQSIRTTPIWYPNNDDAKKSDSHGHQTFGIVFSDGLGNAKAHGILPNGQGYYTNYNILFNTAIGDRAKLVGELIDQHKVMFQTASWGYNRTRIYDARSAEMDALILQHDIPITQSQSNAGNQDSRPQAWAKNIISIGAVYHQGTVDPADDKWNAGGSTGPAQDGRIKPELCAYYDQTTTATVNGGYGTFGGTSGATPMVAGYVGLTIELWTNGAFGNELIPRAEGEDTASYRFKNRPHAQTTKALLVNSATPYPFEGETHDLTRTHQGWGFPDMKSLYGRRSNILVVNESDVLQNLQTKEYRRTVEAGATDFRATLAYADKEATVPTTAGTPHRINNLDLKVTAPDGTIYWGNNGLKVGNTSTPGGEHNVLDTVENVIVANPAAGEWIIEVIADEVNADTHAETPETDADYALVVSNGAPPPPTVAPKK